MRDTITLLVVCSMFLTIFTFILPAEKCQAATLDVGSGYDYENIQDAIDAANNSDTIRVHSGTYEEFIEINKEITLQGDGTSSVIINSKSQSGPTLHTITIKSSNITISGFTIKNTYHASSKHSCILLSASSSRCTISNNIIKEGGNGIYLITSTDNTITGNTIEENEDNGISLGYFSNNNQINNNIIQNSETTGIKISRSAENNFYDNSITSNKDNTIGISIDTLSNNNLFYRNILSENYGGNAFDGGSNTWYNGNQGNYWSDYDDYDSNGDGIGDTPYTNGGVNDLRPLGYFKNQKPTAHISSISPNPATTGEDIQFSGYGTDDGNIIEWEWKINSEVVSASEDFTHTGLSAGTYSIYFRVKDDDGDWSTPPAQQTLTVNPSGGETPNQKPTAYIQNISPQTAEYGEEITFIGYGVDEDGTIQSYNWSSSIDGYLPSSSSFTSTSLSIGTHNIAFKVRDNEYLWSDVVYETVTIEQVQIENEDPVAISNGPYASYVEDAINFDASESYDTDGSISQYRWDFGDGTTTNGETTTHSYTQKGEYTVILTITDNYGAQDTETTTADILLKPGEQEENNETGENNDNNDDDKLIIPGFEAITLISIIILIIALKKKRII